MKQYELVLHVAGSNPQRFSVNEEGLLIGRFAGADVFIDQGNVSRRHARVWMSEGVLCLEYLGSRSGIMLNGERVRNAQLQEGDRFAIGEGVLIVARRNSATATETTAAGGGAGGTGQVDDAHLLNQDDQVIFAKVSKAYRMATSSDDFLQKVLVIVMNSVQAQRGFVFAQPREKGMEPKMLAFHADYDDNNPDGPVLSRYIVDKVLEQGSAYFGDNGRKTVRSNQDGQREEGTMCVPLLGKKECLGVFYVDSPKKSPKFGKAEFERLVSFSRVAGIAVEKARA